MNSESFSKITSRLCQQVATLKSALAKAQERDQSNSAGPSCPSLRLDGALVDAILAQNNSWFHLYVSQLKHSESLSTLQLTQLLVVSTLCCLQWDFKQSVLVSSEAMMQTFAKHLQRVSKVILSVPKDKSEIDLFLWFKECVFALIKCKEDRPRTVSPQLASAGYSFSDQEKFEESISNNPNVSSALGASGTVSDDWLTDATTSNLIIGRIASEDLIKGLIKSNGVLALCSMIRVAMWRSLIVKNHGLEVLMKCSAEPALIAVARLCITTPPPVWRYSSSIFCATACMQLIKSSSYELYLFEAALGLANLLSYSEEVREKIATNENVSVLFECITSTENAQLQKSVLEVICNLSLSPKMELLVSLERVKLLLFFATCECLGQSAAAGALAILSGYETIALSIESTGEKCSILASLVKSGNADLALRGETILANIACYSKSRA